jgi:hypothetical protein
MGNDGGSIPKRCDLVKEKEKERRIDYLQINKARSSFCAISNERLRVPVVGCRMGYLYLKEKVYEAILKKTIPRAFRHIKKLRDIKEINVLENKDAEHENPLICPLSRELHNGINKFLFLWSCGCMMSEEAFNSSDTHNEIKGQFLCPLCGV